MSKPDTDKRTVVSNDGRSVYVEVYRASFKDIGKTGNEYTGRHEFHYRASEGFGLKFQLTDMVDERLLRDAVRTSLQNWLHVTPEIDQASKVTSIMHGRVYVKTTLISPDQIVNRIADTIRNSDVAKSEITLANNADALLWETEALASRNPDLGRLRLELKVRRDELAMATGSAPEALLERILRTEEALAALQEARRNFPIIEASLTTSGKKGIIFDERKIVVKFYNRGMTVRDVKGTLKSPEGAPVVFGPFGIYEAGERVVELGDLKSNIDRVDVSVSCGDIKGNEFRANFSLQSEKDSGDIPFEKSSP